MSPFRELRSKKDSEALQLRYTFGRRHELQRGKLGFEAPSIPLKALADDINSLMAHPCD